MERHAFLRAQEWLVPLAIDACTAHGPAAGEAGAGPTRRQPVTAFVGAASIHISPAEQSAQAHQFAGKAGTHMPAW